MVVHLANGPGLTLKAMRINQIKHLLFAALASVLIVSVTGMELMQARETLLANATTRNEGVAELAAQRVSSIFAEIDMLLRDIDDYVTPQALAFRDGAAGTPSKALTEVCLRKIKNHPSLFSIGVLNANGVYVAGCNREAPLNVGKGFSHREYFSYLAEHPEADTHLSSVFQESSTGTLLVTFSRAIREPGSRRLLGVVMAGLPVADFAEMFDAVSFAAGSAIAVFDASSQMVYRNPGVPDQIGKKLPGGELGNFLKLRRYSWNTVTTSPVDQARRLVSFQRTPYYSYVLIASSRIESDLGDWSQRVIFAVVALTLFIVAVFALASISYRLQVTNRTLRAQSARLSEMATTDGLTGLGNRRKLNEALQKEWARAAREKNKLALLLVDVDYFKRYNDHLGHLQGDECLISLARILEAAVLRPGDLVARYGGEEFCIVLPGLEVEGALIVAERIRKLLGELAMPHPHSPFKDVTVSIGIAAMQPSADLRPDELLKRVDEALYRAKAAGRNRVEY